jgi:hypothetical protein
MKSAPTKNSTLPAYYVVFSWSGSSLWNISTGRQELISFSSRTPGNEIINPATMLFSARLNVLIEKLEVRNT